MPQVGVDNAPLHERLIYGQNGTLYRPVLVDANGNILFVQAAGSPFEVVQSDSSLLKATVDVAAGQTIAVTQATAANLKATVTIPTGQDILARLQGYHASGWRNAPVPFGATAPYAAFVSSDTLSAGSNTLNYTAVAANTVAVITNITLRYTGTVPTSIAAFAVIGGTAYRIFTQLSPASNVVYTWQGWVVLAAGDNLRMVIAGATLNDDADSYGLGFTYSVA